MLTFEKVLEVFADYLDSDDMYEIVMTSHGYTVLEWDDRQEDWTNAKRCRTPKDMADILKFPWSCADSRLIYAHEKTAPQWCGRPYIQISP